VSAPLSGWTRAQQRSRARARERLGEARRAVLAEAAATFNDAFDDAGGDVAPPDVLPEPPTRTHRVLYQLCLAGREPAESLPTAERAHLVKELHGLRWTDQQIARHTRMTTYTTVRIRARLGLSPHFGPGEVSS